MDPMRQVFEHYRPTTTLKRQHLVVGLPTIMETRVLCMPLGDHPSYIIEECE